jgi:hypothetical protein
MKLDDILRTDRSNEQVVRFFDRLWDNLNVPIYKDTEGHFLVGGDFENPKRRVLPEHVPQVVMKGTTQQEYKFIVYKTRAFIVREHVMAEPRRYECDTEDCCDPGLSSMDVMFKHASVEVGCLIVRDGVLIEWGHQENQLPLRDPVDNTISPTRILSLLDGDRVTTVDDDGEVHVTMLDF